jgi:hypothetical protein
MGLYVLEGEGHFSYGNQVRGTIQPSGTSEPTIVSLMDEVFDSYYLTIASIPPIRTDNWQSNLPHVEAEYRKQEWGRTAVCSDLVYELPNALDDLPRVDGWSVYPNPARGEFVVVRPDGLGPVQLHVYNVSGQRILSKNLDQDKERIRCAGLPAGMYIMELTGRDRQHVRLVIE